jgi:hypothetical protein
MIISVPHISNYLINVKSNSHCKREKEKIGEWRFSVGIWSFKAINVTFLLIIFLIEEGFIFLQTKI